jgi:molybdate transport system substrate-binding protein
MKRSKWFMAGALFLGVACVLLAFRREAPEDGIFIYCGAGIRPAMDDLRAEFTEQTGIPVQVAYAGSGCLLSMLTFARSGDLYMPGEQAYVDQAKEQGFLADEATAAYFVPVVMVQKGNPKNIGTLADLARSDIRVGIGNPNSVACGLVAERLLRKAGVWDEVHANIIARGACTATAMELSNALALHALDAAINWDAMAYAVRDKIEILTIPRERNIEVAIPVGILSWSRRKSEATQFIRFAQSEAGRRHFSQHGYHTDLEPYALSYYGDHALQ